MVNGVGANFGDQGSNPSRNNKLGTCAGGKVTVTS